MKNNTVLTEKQITEIKEQANTTRKEMGVYDDVSIADDLLFFIEKKSIIVCEYPFADDVHWDANITIFDNDGRQLVFIGLNSNLYYDEQIFALAHELYHYQTKTGLAFNKDQEEEDLITEKMADRYAAELLLPGEVLKRNLVKTFVEQNINDVAELRMLRFVAKLQIEWWLPYRSIILRLYEEGGLSVKRRDELLQIDCRDVEGNYAKIFMSIDPEKHSLLNSKSGNISITKSTFEVIIRNFEDGYISEDEFVKILALFGKKPFDFGFDISADLDDGDLKQFFSGGKANEC